MGETEISTCKLCGNAKGNREHIATEMFFGLGGSFRYLECGACMSLQLLDIPSDVGRYYPSNYYSLAGESQLKRMLKGIRARHAMVKPSVLGALLTRAFGPANLAWLSKLNIGLNKPILDVGCGSGEILRELATIGFTDLTGIDPHAREETRPRIIRASVEDAPRREYKLVMMHHALEHCPDPVSVLRTTRRLVQKDGHVLIRIPLAGKLAWRKYGTSWVQLDAPRHIVLFSEQAFRDAAERCGFVVSETVFDSAPSQFLASEQYLRGIPLVKQTKPSQDQLKHYASLTQDLNRIGDGDQACFFLKPR